MSTSKKYIQVGLKLWCAITFDSYMNRLCNKSLERRIAANVVVVNSEQGICELYFFLAFHLSTDLTLKGSVISESNWNFSRNKLYWLHNIFLCTLSDDHSVIIRIAVCTIVLFSVHDKSPRNTTTLFQKRYRTKTISVLDVKIS